MLKSRYLAIDIGGTNLRVGFVELLGGGNTLETASSHQHSENSELPKSHVHQTQKSWPIGEKLKQEKAEDLFAWIGECIATVIEDAPKPVLASQMDELPMGVTFSFPMM